jgi:DNA-binding NarL/FixJ family response regulator
MNTVVIVDDHILIAKALASIINSFEGFEVLYEVENGIALQGKLASRTPAPNIILLDISMPLMNGFETATWLTQNHPNILILALSMQNDDESVIKMIKCGAKGYLLKNAHPNDLNVALNEVISKGFYYTEEVSKLLVQQLHPKNKYNPIQFTDREITFLHYVATELTYKEIADIMHLSPKTIDGYRETLFQKLDIKSRVGLAMYAIKNGYDNQ